MSDNLKQVKQKVATDIDPNGGPQSVLVQNHKDILDQFLSSSGKYVGSSFLSKKTEALYSIGIMSWNSNPFNASGPITLSFSKNNTDNVDFGKTLQRMRSGDVLVFKDFVGRVGYFNFVSFSENTSGTNPFYEVVVEADADNINYTYQDNEEEICVISSIMSSGIDNTIIIGGNPFEFKAINGTKENIQAGDLALDGKISATELGKYLKFVAGDPLLLASWEILESIDIT